ncbi:MAG: Jag N-terminal domain-containing protein [Myxococcales bacterium]|nr:Jag N-terminal domain-containing protein [Myxococcales bacterium]
MSNTMEFEGRSEQEAVAKACAALKLAEEGLDYTVVDEGSGGVFGIGARPVQIRVRVPAAAAVAAAPAVDANDDDSMDEGKGGMVGPAPEKAAKALEVAKGLAERMGLGHASITVRDDHEQIVVLIDEADGSTDVAEVLGRSRPPAIPSFQFLLNKIVNRFPEDRKHIIVEVPSVPRKERRSEERSSEARPAPALDPDLDPSLVALARSLAEKAQALGKVITVHPMLPADRRALHQTITTISGVSTVSEGEGLYRRLHIVPDSLKAGTGKKRRRRRRRRRREDGAPVGPEVEGAEDLDDEVEDDGAELQDASA